MVVLWAFTRMPKYIFHSLAPEPAIAKGKTRVLKPKSYNGDRAIGEVVVLTGGQDRSYVFGLTTALSQRGIHVHVVGNDRVDNIAFHTSDRITFVDRGGMRPNSAFLVKLLQLTIYYLRLIGYVSFGSPKIVHILWNNKF